MLNRAFTGPAQPGGHGPASLKSPLAALLGGDDAAAVAGYRAAIVAVAADVEARYGLASALAASGDGAGRGRRAGGSPDAARPAAGQGGGRDLSAHRGRRRLCRRRRHPALRRPPCRRRVGDLRARDPRRPPSASGLLSYGALAAAPGSGRGGDRRVPRHGAALSQRSRSISSASSRTSWSRTGRRVTPPPPGPGPSAGRRKPRTPSSPIRPRDGRRCASAMSRRRSARCRCASSSPRSWKRTIPAAVAVFLYPATDEHEKDWPAHIGVRPIGHLDDARRRRADPRPTGSTC